MTIHLEQTDPELQRAWATFADPIAEHNGSTWQYLGSEATPTGYSHCFRHRDHPDGSGRQYHRIPASPNWEQDVTKPLGR